MYSIYSTLLCLVGYVHGTHSQRCWPHRPGVSNPGGCPSLKMGGASDPEGWVHGDALSNPPTMCQMLKGHLQRQRIFSVSQNPLEERESNSP